MLGTAVLWGALCAAIALLGLDRALAAAVEVDAHSAHRAVWRIFSAERSGTAFAIGDHHFITCAHVIKGFADHGAKEVLIDRHGSEDSRTLQVNYDRVALALVQDIALFTTRKTVDHHFTLAETSAAVGETGLRAMGYPLGQRIEILRQTDPIAYQDEFQVLVPADRITQGGLSGSPVFRDDGKVVGMYCQGSSNLIIAAKVGHLRRFLDGDLPRTACRDFPSVQTCVERATIQARELAEAGDRVAQYQLGRDDGSLDKDLAMLRRAAEGGWASAQYTLGLWLSECKQGAEAVRWFRQSAAQEDPTSVYQLGLAHYRGCGVTQDRVRAFELMLQAAHSGYAVAEYGLGCLYERGHGTTQDAAKARQWFQRAADKGLKEAQQKLGSLATTSADGAFRPACTLVH